MATEFFVTFYSLTMTKFVIALEIKGKHAITESIVHCSSLFSVASQ
jgi:hypothetical protein